jgi:hypothetical protein
MIGVTSALRPTVTRRSIHVFSTVRGDIGHEHDSFSYSSTVSRYLPTRWRHGRCPWLPAEHSFMRLRPGAGRWPRAGLRTRHGVGQGQGPSGGPSGKTPTTGRCTPLASQSEHGFRFVGREGRAPAVDAFYGDASGSQRRLHCACGCTKHPCRMPLMRVRGL